MPTALILLLLAASQPMMPGSLAGQPFEKPVLHAGDQWHYKNMVEQQGRFSETHDESTIVRTQADALVLKIHAMESPLQPTEVIMGDDWSRFRSIDGHEQVVNRPFSFPLTTGKSWTVDYRETNPNRNFSSEQYVTTYRVTGVERITVPAGSFDAVKIEATGRWTAALAPVVTGSATTRSDVQGVAVTNRLDRQLPGEATGRLYKAFWYAPAVKRAVRVVEESYNSGGIRTESRTSELESYKLAE